MNPILTLVAALLAWVAWRRRGAARRPARAVIVSPRRSTVISRDGAVRSAQSAELSVREADVDQLWSPENLENLARTYWLFLSRVTLGLVRVVYGHNERRVVLLSRRLTLLRFDPPQYTLEGDHGKVTWCIRDGLLVAPTGRSSGYLALDVTRRPSSHEGRVKLCIEVEVANFYPSIASTFSTPVYTATQSLIHVLVTHSFLRSLAKLELAESKVKRLAPDEDEGLRGSDDPDRPGGSESPQLSVPPESGDLSGSR